jgi:glycogen(starch) synthase
VEQGIGTYIWNGKWTAGTDEQQASVEVEPIEPKDPALIATIKSMSDRGIQMLYGRWLIDGAPRVLLFDTGTAYRWLDEWKGDLWSTAGIPSPPGDAETNEAIVFGYTIAWFLGEVRLPFRLP